MICLLGSFPKIALLIFAEKKVALKTNELLDFKNSVWKNTFLIFTDDAFSKLNEKMVWWWTFIYEKGIAFSQSRLSKLITLHLFFRHSTYPVALRSHPNMLKWGQDHSCPEEGYGVSLLQSSFSFRGSESLDCHKEEGRLDAVAIYSRYCGCFLFFTSL